MKKFVGIAVVAAIAGAVITLLVRERSQRQMGRSRGELAKADEPQVPARTQGMGFTVEELIAEQPSGPRTLNS